MRGWTADRRHDHYGYLVHLRCDQAATADYTVRLNADDTIVLARSQMLSDPRLARVFWTDASGKELLEVEVPWLFNEEQSDRLSRSLWTATEKALFLGGWLAKLHRELNLLPQDALLTRKTARQGRQPDFIPIGAATALVSKDAIAKSFCVSRRAVSDWLTLLGVPIQVAPNRAEYISLWQLELCILRNGLEVSWTEAAEILKAGQTVYGAATRHTSVERLRKLAQDLKPNRASLRRRLGEGRPPDLSGRRTPKRPS